MNQASKAMLTRMEVAESTRKQDLSAVDSIEEKLSRLSERIETFESHGQDSSNRVASLTCTLAARVESLSTSLEKVAETTELQFEKMKAVFPRLQQAEQSVEK